MKAQTTHFLSIFVKSKALLWFFSLFEQPFSKFFEDSFFWMNNLPNPFPNAVHQWRVVWGRAGRPSVRVWSWFFFRFRVNFEFEALCVKSTKYRIDRIAHLYFICAFSPAMSKEANLNWRQFEVFQRPVSPKGNHWKKKIRKGFPLWEGWNFFLRSHNKRGSSNKTP